MSRQQQLIPMAVGERLRHRREEKGIETAQIAETLRMDEHVVHSIEADRLGHLAPLYRRGYINTYASFLGFEPDEVSQMIESVGDHEPELHTVFPEAGPPDKADQWIKATSYVLASLLVGTLAWQFSREAMRLSQEVSTSDQGTIPATQLSAANSDPGSNARHVNASIASLEGIRRSEPARSSAGEQAWEAIQTPVQQPDETAQIETQQIPQAPAPQPQVESNAEAVLVLSTSGDSWVEMRDSLGKQLEVDIVRGGTRKEYRGMPPFSIQFGRPMAISLTVNGQAIDLEPYTVNGVTQMVLGREDFPQSP